MHRSRTRIDEVHVVHLVSVGRSTTLLLRSASSSATFRAFSANAYTWWPIARSCAASVRIGSGLSSSAIVAAHQRGFALSVPSDEEQLPSAAGDDISGDLLGTRACLGLNDEGHLAVALDQPTG
jgi:hypothetical protein